MSELDVYRPRAELAVPAANDTDSWTAVLNEVAQLASQIANTPFVPDGLRGSAPAVAAAILSGRELGLGPMTSLANIHVIKGKPTLSAALMRALILAQGHQIETVDISDTRCVIRGRRRGEAEWEEAVFTADHAKRAGIQLGGYPQDKLYARASTRLARRKFADVIAGMPYSTEEIEDGGDPLNGGDVILSGEMDGQPLSARAAIEQPKSRTAQRARSRAQTSPPAPAASSPGAPPPSAERAGGDLPPLPGEEEITAPVSGGDARAEQSATAGSPDPGRPDETDYDTPGTVTQGQITAIWTSLTMNYTFTSKEKGLARGVCAHIVAHPLESTTHLSRNEAKTILDTLGHWQYQAEQAGKSPRDYMTSLMAEQDEDPREQDGTASGGE